MDVLLRILTASQMLCYLCKSVNCGFTKLWFDKISKTLYLTSVK